MRFTRRINSRGTITLPASVREALAIDDGDILEMAVIQVVAASRGSRPVPEAVVREEIPGPGPVE